MPDSFDSGAFEDDQESTPTPLTDEALLDIIVTFVNAQGWDASQQVIQAHPELLLPQVDVLFDALIQMSRAQNDPRSAAILAMHRDVLRMCREAGVTETFRRVKADGNIETLLDGIAQATILVMTSQPQNRDAWLDSMRDLHTEARELQDAPLTELTGAIVQLLSGEPAIAIRPSLDGLYKTCWDVIARTLSSSSMAARLRVEMLDSLARNTLVAHGGDSTQRQAWLGFIRMIHVQAEDLHDLQMAALTDAIIGLLEGMDPATLKPDLKWPYRVCWERLTAEWPKANHV